MILLQRHIFLFYLCDIWFIWIVLVSCLDVKYIAREKNNHLLIMVIGLTRETLMQVTEGFIRVAYRLLDSVLQLSLFR
jgi:hypothetical protein